jgi:phage shock protein A
MSQHDGTNLTTISASDDADSDTPRVQRSRRRLENRRNRHNAHRELRAAEQTPIRRLLAGAA